MAEWRDRRLAALNEALERLDPADRGRIDLALPVLGRLVDLLEETP